MLKKMDWFKQIPTLLALFAMGIALWAYMSETLYANYFYGITALYFFLAWVAAIIEQQESFLKQGLWSEKKKVMIAMGLCLVLGGGMLIYYEIQRPKYEVAIVDGLDYKVPPQLNKKELIAWGADCNTYGNTICSHQVFARLAKENPQNISFLVNLAMAQTHLGFYEPAIANFKTALSHNYKSHDLFKFYGRAHEKAGQKQQAIQAYQQSLKLNPYQSSLKRAILRLQAENK